MILSTKVPIFYQYWNKYVYERNEHTQPTFNIKINNFCHGERSTFNIVKKKANSGHNGSSLLLIDGFHVTYLFWSLHATVQFFGGKKLEPLMGKSTEWKKEKETQRK